MCNGQHDSEPCGKDMANAETVRSEDSDEDDYEEIEADITVAALPMDEECTTAFGLMKIDEAGCIIEFAENFKGKKYFPPQLLDALPLKVVFKPFDRGREGNPVGKNLECGVTSGFDVRTGIGLNIVLYSTLLARCASCRYELKLPSHYLVSPQETERASDEYLKNGIHRIAGKENLEVGHVTFGWNGNCSGYFNPTLEEYMEMPSDSRITFKVQPKMKAVGITEKVRDAILSRKFDQVRVILPNGHMAGHTGDIDATVVACKAADEVVKITLEAIKQVGATYAEIVESYLGKSVTKAVIILIRAMNPNTTSLALRYFQQRLEPNSDLLQRMISMGKLLLSRNFAAASMLSWSTKVHNLIHGQVRAAGGVILKNFTTRDEVVLYFQPCVLVGVGAGNGNVNNVTEEPKDSDWNLSHRVASLLSTLRTRFFEGVDNVMNPIKWVGLDGPP